MLVLLFLSFKLLSSLILGMLICQMGITVSPSFRNVVRMRYDFIIMANTGSCMVSLPPPLSFYITVSTWQSGTVHMTRGTLVNCKSYPIGPLVKSLPSNSWSLQSSQWSVRSDLYPCPYLSPPCTFLSIFLAVHTPNSGSLAVLSSLPGILFLQVFALCLAPSHPSDFCSRVTLQLRLSQHSLCSYPNYSLTN